MCRPVVPVVTEMHDMAMEAPGGTRRWNSIIVDVLKPISSGRASPTSLERNLLDSYIMDCWNLHASLDAIETLLHSTGETSGESENMGSKLWRLRKSRIILRERIERCSIAMTPGPIRCLPPEMISEIFYHCLPQTCRPDPSTAPLLLCRVSSLWQDIAHTTRSLWNRLDFTSQWKPNLKPFIQSFPSYGPSQSTSLFRQWLSHASRSRITMTFDCLNEDVLPDVVNMILLPNVVDLLRLEICLPSRITHTPFNRFFALPPHTLQSLKYLVLAQGLPDARATVFRSSPCLTHLLLDDLNFAVESYKPGEIPMLQPVFPWVQITHLTITRCIELELWVSVLSFCRTLEVGSFSLDLRGMDFDPGNNGTGSESEDENGAARDHFCGSRPIPIVDEPVTLPFLKELDLIVGCGESFPLERFRFPALNALRFHRGHMPHVSPYQRRLAASQPDEFSWKNSLTFISALESLNVLSLAGRVGSVDEIMTLFHHVPSVDFLDLDIQVDHSALFRALTVTSQDPLATVSLPCLGYLRLLLEPGDIRSFSENTIRNMVQSRLRPPHGISKLEGLNILTNTFRRGHLDVVKSIAENAKFYIPTNVDVELKASRSVPWKRCANV